MPRPKILLVDDNKLFLELEQEFLKDLDVTTMRAGEGWEALALMARNRPDLVFLDLHMPLMDGVDCCAAMKSDPELRKIPVIIVSNIENEEDLVRCREAGCDGLLAKPVSKKAILESCRKFLRGTLLAEERVTCRTQVVFRSDSCCNYGMSEDLGLNSIYIGFTGEIQVGERLLLNFVLPGRPDGLIEAPGRVAWVNKGASATNPRLPEGFGVEFQQLDENCRRLIGGFLATGGEL